MQINMHPYGGSKVCNLSKLEKSFKLLRLFSWKRVVNLTRVIPNWWEVTREPLLFWITLWNMERGKKFAYKYRNARLRDDE